MRFTFSLSNLAFLLLIVVIFFFSGCNQPPALRVYCAASFRPTMEKLAEQYESETGVAVQLQLGGSNMLLSQIELSQSGDLFLPAESWYLEQARQKGLAGPSQSLGTMHAVLVSQQEANPVKSTLAEWLQDKPKFSYALPEVAAIGRVTQKTLVAAGAWESLHELIIAKGVYKTTVTEVANDVAMGTVDLGIVWNVVAKRYDKLLPYELPELANAVATIAIAPLTTSKQPEVAATFVEYVAHSEFATNEWKTAGLEALSNQPER